MAAKVSKNIQVISPTPEAFDQEYRERHFITWYRMGKPGLEKFYPVIEPNEHNQIPTKRAVRRWIEKWRQRAKVIDEEAFNEMRRRLAAEKTEILMRHAKQAREMQDVAIRWLKEHQDELTATSAVQLWRMAHEHELRAMGLRGKTDIDKTDEELLRELKALIADSPTEFEQLLEEIEGGDAEAS